MTFTVALILWLILLVLVVQLAPATKWTWGKLVMWAGLTLITLVLVLLKAITFKG